MTHNTHKNINKREHIKINTFFLERQHKELKTTTKKPINRIGKDMEHNCHRIPI